MNNIFELKDGRRVLIRLAEKSDYKAVQVYVEQLAQETIFTNQYVGQNQKTLEEFEKALQHCSMFVVLDKDKVIGILSVHPHKKEHPWLKYTCSFGVHMLRAYYHQGLGHKLMDVLENCAKEHQMHRIEGEVRQPNLAGIALYTQHGFTIEGCKKDVALINGKWYNNYIIAKILD